MTSILPQGVRYLMVGIVNTLIGLGTIYALLFVGVGSGLANLLGYAVGLAVGFVLNSRWTFRLGRRDVASIARYGVSAASCYVLNLTIVIVCSRERAVNIYVAQLLGVAAYTVAMFVACRVYVFRPDGRRGVSVLAEEHR